MVGANQVHLGKDGFTSQIGCKILDMRNGVAIRSCDAIQPAVVPTWAPFTIAFGDHVEWRGPIVQDDGHTIPMSRSLLNSALVATKFSGERRCKGGAKMGQPSVTM